MEFNRGLNGNIICKQGIFQQTMFDYKRATLDVGDNFTIVLHAVSLKQVFIGIFLVGLIGIHVQTVQLDLCLGRYYIFRAYLNINLILGHGQYCQVPTIHP
jgi:hypothetical protein